MTCLSDGGRVLLAAVCSVLMIKMRGWRSDCVWPQSGWNVGHGRVSWSSWRFMHNSAHVCCSNWKHTNISTPSGNPKLKVKSWKTIFFKSQEFYMWSILKKKRKKTIVSMEDIWWGERRFFNMLFWSKQTIPQSKPNFPLYAKYVSHHPTDRCNFMMV